MIMSSLARGLCLGVFFCCATQIVCGQKAKHELLLNQCNGDVASSLVEMQVADSKTVESSEKQIKILLRAADFLWQSNQPTAKKLFTDALEIARQTVIDDKKKIKSVENNFDRQTDPRFQVIAAIAKHDSAWANKLTDLLLREGDSTEDDNSKNQKSLKDNYANQFLDVANSLLKSNKQTAFEFARRAASIPFGHNSGMRWHSFLYRAAAIDQAATDALYSELIIAQANSDFTELTYLSGYPFGYGRTYGTTNSSIESDVPASFQANPTLQRRLINLMLNKTLTLQPHDAVAKHKWQVPTTSVAFSFWQDLESLVAERLPDLLQRVTAAKTQAGSWMSTDATRELETRRGENEIMGLPFAKKLAELEKKEKESGSTDYEIVDLIFTAKTEAELKQANEWIIKINEEKVSDDAANFINFKRAEAAITENRLSDAVNFAEKVIELEHRAVLYFKIAEAKLKEERDKNRAAEVLETVAQAASKAPNGVERAQVLLGTAFWFEKYNQYRASETLNEAVKVINRLDNPNIFAASIERRIKGKEFTYSTSFETPGYNLEKSFAAVAKSDFQGALNQARNFDDKYLRTLAVIAVVGDCAKVEPKKPASKLSGKKPIVKPVK